MKRIIHSLVAILILFILGTILWGIKESFRLLVATVTILVLGVFILIILFYPIALVLAILKLGLVEGIKTFTPIAYLRVCLEAIFDD